MFSILIVVMVSWVYICVCIRTYQIVYFMYSLLVNYILKCFKKELNDNCSTLYFK